MWVSTGLLAPGSEGRQAIACTSPKRYKNKKHFVSFAKCQWPIILIQSEFTLILKPFTEEIWKGNIYDWRKQTWCLQYVFSFIYIPFCAFNRQLILYLNAHERSLHLLCSTCPSPPLWPVSSWITPSYKYSQLSEQIIQQNFFFFNAMY